MRKPVRTVVGDQLTHKPHHYSVFELFMLMQLLFPQTVLTRISTIQGPLIPLSWEGLCRGQEYLPEQLLLLLLPQAQKDSKNLC